MRRICDISDLVIHSVQSLPTEKRVQDLTDRENTTYELAFYFSGIDRIDFCGERIVTSPGMIRFQPKKKRGERYVITNIEPVESVDVFFDTSTALPETSLYVTAEDRSELKSLFVKLESVWRRKRAGYMNNCRSLFYRILYLIEKSENTAESRDHLRIAPALDYIHSHYTELNFPYDSMAELCSVSSCYFRRVFLRYTGVTLTAYVKRLRMEYAAELLSSPIEKSISDVARLVGYDNIYYFSKLFKQFFGATPTEYKKR